MTTQVAGRENTQAALVGRLRETFARGRTRELSWRLRQLDGIARLCDEREAEIAEAARKDLGREPVEAWLTEIAGTHAEAQYARRHVRGWMQRQQQPLPLRLLPGTAWVQHEPRGVVLVIGPWNYPIFLTLTPLVSAVAAGNCVVVKPSEHAPATSALLARLLPEYLDPEAVAVVEGDADVAADLLAQGFDHVLFTGGTETGRKVMAQAAAHLTPVTLELGGKCPAYVDEDADLAISARRIVTGKLLNSGQTCIAPDYVLAHRAVRDELVEHLRTALVDFRVGQVERGQPIVNEWQFDRLAGYLTATKGSVVTGGGADARRLRIEPTVVVDPDPEEPMMTEEIFGPILPVLSVGSVDEAIRFVSSRPKPLAAYVFTRSRTKRRRFVDEVPCGGMVVNHVMWQVLAPTLPFGGVGPSGIGAYHGKWGFDTFSHRKAVLAKTFRPEIRLVYTPYKDWAVTLLRRLF